MRKIFTLLLALLPTFVLLARQDNQSTIDTVINCGTITFDDLRSTPIQLTIHDMRSLASLDPHNFDISVKVENDFLYEKPELSLNGNTIILDIHPKGEWCECLFPTNLNVNICSSQKTGTYDTTGTNYKPIISHLRFKVVKTRAWLPRCFWVIASIIGLVLLILYLRAMLKKRRFKKYASISPIYYDQYGEKVDDGANQPLREKGFAAWFSRWFLPGDEKCTLNFFKPQVDAIPFTAAESSEVILLPKAYIDPNTMEISGYDPTQDPHPEEPLKVADKSTITFRNSVGNATGYLSFNAYEKNDGRGYTVFLSLLLAAAILAVIGLLYLMIRSFM